MSQDNLVHGAFGTPEEIAYEARAQEGAIWSGGRLLIAILAMAFASLAFAYFYLRSSNVEDLWRPHRMTAPTGIGAAVMAMSLAAAVLMWIGVRRFRRSISVDWEVAGWLSVGAALCAAGMQVWELTDLPFHPGSSGYSSVFVGWAGMNIAVLIVGAYWTETLLARQLRLRHAVSEEGGTAYAGLSSRIFRVNVETCANFWAFIGLVAVFFWIFFYVAG